jgi:hypothetical protein
MWENSKKYAGNIVFICSQPSSQDGEKIRQSGTFPTQKQNTKKPAKQIGSLVWRRGIPGWNIFSVVDNIFLLN